MTERSAARAIWCPERGAPLRMALVALGALLVAPLAHAEGLPALGERIVGEAVSALVDTGGAPPDLARDLQAFDPTTGEAERFAWTLAPTEVSWDGARVYELTYPTPRPSPHPVNNTVHGRFYPARGIEPGARAPLAIVLHHLGGDFTAEAILADFLARSGIHALEVEFPYYGPRRPRDGGPRGLLQGDLVAAVEAFRQGIADVRRGLDWALTRPDVDPERVGVFGISLGGIVGSIAAGVDPRLKRNVFVIAGADLPTILTHDSREMREVRRVCAERGIDRAQLTEIVRPIEPARYAARMDPAGVLMLNALTDEVVPRASTDALIAAIGAPNVEWYETGHYTIAIFLLDLFARARDHYLRDAPTPAAPAAAGADAAGS